MTGLFVLGTDRSPGNADPGGSNQAKVKVCNGKVKR